MYAVIRTGGKQYKVAPEDVLQIEKIEGAAGEAVQFSDVLMVGGEGEPRFGSPLVSGTVVSAEVVEHGRGPKIIIFKKKRRQNYRRKKGHRQELTTVRILEILTGGVAAKVKENAAAAFESEAGGVALPEQEGAETKRVKAAETDAAPESGAKKPKKAPQVVDLDDPDPAPKKPRGKKAE